MTNPAELAAHPMYKLARVLTWGALGMLVYGAVNWVAAQPWFALRTIEVRTPTAHVTEAQVQLVAERRVRGTFFTVELEHVRSSLEKLPWVREARVERRWPDTLVVSLVEHVPLARWNDDALVSAAGDVFVAAANQSLPRLYGPEDSSAEVVAAYRSYQSTLAPLAMKIDEVRLTPRRAWRLKLDNGMQLALGREHAQTRLARFVAVYPALFAPRLPVDEAETATETVQPVAVDLRYPDGFSIRMPADVQPFKPSTT